MNALALSPEQIISGVFAWVLGSSKAFEGAEPVDPDTLALQRLTHSLSPAQAASLWAYLQAVAHLDSQLRRRALDAAAAMEPAEHWESRALPVLCGALERASGPLTAAGLLKSPPPELVSAIDSFVQEAASSSPGARKPLAGLKPIVFQHPADRALLNAFQSLPLAGKLSAGVMDFVARQTELSLLSNGILVTPSSLPTLHGAYLEACRTLDVPEPFPPLFVVSGVANAFCVGADRPFLQVSSSLVNLLKRDELLFILGHELGHALCGHTKHHTLASALRDISGGLLSSVTLGLSNALLNATVAPALAAWCRQSELSADRAGLLACGSLGAALRALAKLAGHPLVYFKELHAASLLDQARLYSETLAASRMDRARNAANLWSASHPPAVVRAAELLGWAEDGSFTEILDADPGTLARLADVISADPNTHLLASRALQALTAWAADSFDVPRSQAGPLLRRMVYDQTAPAGTPLESILRIEMRACKARASTLEYVLGVLVSSGTEAQLVEISVPASPAWEDAPASLREELVRRGGKEVVRLLFTVEESSLADSFSPAA